MSVVELVLKEEVDRLKLALQRYEKMLESLPKGYIFIRKVNSNCFVYRKKKVNGKVISEYIGKEGSDKANKAIEDAKEYKRIKSNIRIAKNEFNKLRRIYKIYD